MDWMRIKLKVAPKSKNCPSQLLRIMMIGLLILSLLFGSFNQVQAQFGRFLYLDGVNDELEVGGFVIPRNSDFTVEFMFIPIPEYTGYYNDIWNDSAELFFNYFLQGAEWECSPQVSVCGLFYTPSYDHKCYFVGAKMSPFQWNHLVIQYDKVRKQMRYWINSLYAGTLTLKYDFHPGSTLHFGRNYSRSNPGIKGYIDEFRISNIQRYSSAGPKQVPIAEFSPDTNTIALWHFNDFKFQDTSGNGNHLKTKGNPVVRSTMDTSARKYNLDFYDGYVLCKGDSIKLNASIGQSSYLWPDGSIDSTYVVKDSGDIIVKIGTKCGTYYDTIHIKKLVFEFDLGKDTTICGEDTMWIKLPENGATYKWQDGKYGSNYPVSKKGLFRAEGRKGNCTFIDQVYVDTLDLSFDLGKDTMLCLGDSLWLKAGTKDSFYWWNGSLEDSLIINHSGKFALTAHNGNCNYTDTFIVETLNIAFLLPDDTTLCVYDSLWLKSPFPSAINRWSGDSSSNDSIFSTNTEGTYHLTIDSMHCSYQDSIRVFVLDRNFNLGPDTTLCLGDTLFMEGNSVFDKNVWFNGKADTIENTSTKGTYWLTQYAAHCQFSDTVEVNVLDLTFNLGSDTVLCNEANIELSTNNKAETQLWSNGSTDTIYKSNLSGWHWLEIGAHHCRFRDSLFVDSVDIRFTLGSDTVICSYDSLTLKTRNNVDEIKWQDGSEQPEFVALKSGLYSVLVRKSGCVYADTINVGITDLTFSIGRDTLLCEGETLMLNSGRKDIGNRWQDGSTGSTFMVSNSGTYYVQIDDGKCSASDTVFISYSDVKAVFDTSSVADFTYCFSPQKSIADNFYWGFQHRQDIVSTNGRFDVDKTRQNPDTVCFNFGPENDCYFVCLKTVKGRCADTLCVPICTVISKDVFIPNVFTPSTLPEGDGYNDVWQIDHYLNNTTITVFNRWGEQVFQSSENHIKWNGKANNTGEYCPAGTYFYIFKSPYEQRSGTVTLIWE